MKSNIAILIWYVALVCMMAYERIHYGHADIIKIVLYLFGTPFAAVALVRLGHYLKNKSN